MVGKNKMNTKRLNFYVQPLNIKKTSIKVMKVILERMIRNLHIFELDFLKKPFLLTCKIAIMHGFFYSFKCTGKGQIN